MAHRVLDKLQTILSLMFPLKRVAGFVLQAFRKLDASLTLTLIPTLTPNT